MRVITGSARGKKLKTLDGLATRPTTDRVKEAIFNIIQFDIDGRKILDLFGGSGQLAIECLSRGAAHAVIVDQSRDAVSIIKENLKNTGFSNQANVYQLEALRFLTTTTEHFDIIFLDPPYAEKLLEESLKLISEIDILSEGGIIVCERPRDKQLPASIGSLICSKDYNYGKISVNLYTE